MVAGGRPGGAGANDHRTAASSKTMHRGGMLESRRGQAGRLVRDRTGNSQPSALPATHSSIRAQNASDGSGIPAGCNSLPRRYPVVVLPSAPE